jgi:glucokinase
MTENDRIAAIGVDVGGTFIKAGLLRADGAVVDKRSAATEVDGGVDHVIGRIAGLIGDLHQAAAAAGLEVRAVGLGMPGTLSRRRGVVIAPPNLRGWRNVPVVERLESLTGLRVVLDNDANLAALGEYRCGAGRGTRDMVMLTLGTGIGGGIILGGKLWHGAGENAGEFGHAIAQPGGRRCGCGQLGCLEAYASAASTAVRAAEMITGGQPSCLKDILDRGGLLEAHHVVEAASGGDALAQRVWAETCRYLAVGCINIQCALDPERIVLAGGMSAAGERLLQPVRKAIAELGSESLGARARVCIAELGNDAGFLGAAMAAFDEAGAGA